MKNAIGNILKRIRERKYQKWMWERKNENEREKKQEKETSVLIATGVKYTTIFHPKIDGQKFEERERERKK